MGTVYLAYQDSLGRDLAIKLMANEFVRDEEFVERFRREGRIAARLRHPNIVQVYDFSDRDGLYYIAMEYLGSRTLKCYIRERGRVGVEDAARLCDQLLAALDHAHAQGIVHRDIKPANVMVTDGGDAALTDFSIAQMKSASKLTQTGSVLGTPEYMAPEQFEGKADGRADLYATGVILYEMLTGFSPFHAETIAEIMKKQLFTAPDPPTLVDFTIPESVSQVVVKSLAKNPDERYQTAAEMRQALRTAMSAAGSTASVARPIPTELKAIRVEAQKQPVEPATSKTCAACGKVVNQQRFCPGCGHDTARPARSAEAQSVSPGPATLGRERRGRGSTLPVTPAGSTPPPPAAPVPVAASPVAPSPPPKTPVVATPPSTPVRLDLRADSDSQVIRPSPPSSVPAPAPPPPSQESERRQRAEISLAPDPAPPLETQVASGKAGRNAAVRFFEDQGTAILGWASLGCFFLVGPLILVNNSLTQMFACGGVLGMVLLLPASTILSIFLFFRRASPLRVAAPFCVAAGLLIALFTVFFHLVRSA